MKKFAIILSCFTLLLFDISLLAYPIAANCWSSNGYNCTGPNCTYSCAVNGKIVYETCTGGAYSVPTYQCSSGFAGDTTLTGCDTSQEAKAICGGGGGGGIAAYSNGCTVGLTPTSVTAGDQINISVTNIPNNPSINGSVVPTGQCSGVVGSCAGSPTGNCTGYTTSSSNTAGTCTVTANFSATSTTPCTDVSQCGTNPAPGGSVACTGGFCVYSETCSNGAAVNCTPSGTNTQIAIPTATADKTTLNGMATGALCPALSSLTYSNYDQNNPLPIPTDHSVTAMCVLGTNSLGLSLVLKGNNGSVVTIKNPATPGTGYVWNFGAPSTGVYNVSATAIAPALDCSSQDNFPAQYFVCANSTAPGSATNLAANGNSACPATKISAQPIISWGPPSSWGYSCPGPNNNTYTAQITDPSTGNAVVASFGPTQLTSFTAPSPLQYNHTYNYNVVTNNGALSGPAASCSFTTTNPIWFQTSGGNVTAFGALSDAVPGPTNSPTTVEDNNASVNYTGSWTRNSSSNASGGTWTTSTATGATATLSVSGASSFSIVARMCTTMGIANVTVDGQVVSTLDEYRSPCAWQVVNGPYSLPNTSTHTVGLSVTGTKNGNSSAVTVNLDAFIVNNTTAYYLNIPNSTSSAGIVVGSPASVAPGYFSQTGLPATNGWNLTPYVAKTPIPNLSYTTIRNNALNLAGITPSTLASYCTQNLNSKPNNFVSGNYHFWCIESTSSGSTLDDRITKALAATDNNRYHIILIDPAASSVAAPFVSNPAAAFTIDRKILVLLTDSLQINKGVIVNSTAPTNGGNSALLVLIDKSTTNGDLLASYGFGQMDGFYVFPGIFNDSNGGSRTQRLQSDGSLIAYGQNAFSGTNGLNGSYNTNFLPAETWSFNPKYIEIFRPFFGVTKYTYNEIPPQ